MIVNSSEFMNSKTMYVNNKEFQVIKLLGKGKGGYSWLVERDGKQYVLKQIHHEPCDYYQFGDKLQSELNDYQFLKDAGIPIPEMLDVDQKRERILKEFIDGPVVADLVATRKLDPRYLEQVQAMTRILYPLHINIDYYPTNFVVQDGQLFYIDYEKNDYMEEWNFENWGIQYWK